MPEAKLPYVTNIRAIGHQLAGEQLVVDRKPGCEANSLVVDYDLSQSDQSELSISSKICIACNNLIWKLLNHDSTPHLRQPLAYIL